MQDKVLGQYRVPPQLKDLPRTMTIGLTCRSCDRHWSERVQDLIERRHMGADYIDLLEWKLRCDCDGLVRVALPIEATGEREEGPRLSSELPEALRMPYPIKAVVKARPQATGNGPAPVRHPLAAFPH